MSATATGLLREPWIDLPPAVDGAVDHFDATARLESQGIGDAAAVRAGHDDVFALAGAWLAKSPTPVEDETAAPNGVVTALARVLVMASGVAICLMMIPPTGWNGAALVAGAASWIGGQAISASLWWGKGAGREVQGNRGALVAGVLIVTTSIVLAWVTREPAIIGWAAWGCSIAVALTCVDNMRLAAVTAGCATIALLGLALPSGQTVPAAVIVVAATAWAGRELVRRSRGVRPGRPALRMLALIGLAILQSFAHMYVLLALYRLVGDQFTIVMWASLISTASSEPLLELATVATRRLAASQHHWKRLRRNTALTGALTILAVGLIGADAANVACLITSGRLPGEAVFNATLAVSVLTSGCGVLLRTGSAGGAAALAVLGALVATLVPTATGWFALVTAVGGCLFIAFISARQFASPKSW